uniref:Fgenesh protein 64 n=1 Tax=Beta vulgaris TaxID=161934 RepID=Q20CD5_BETVU|nr:Fgenesh protein 64 [Beta vulgaris]
MTDIGGLSRKPTLMPKLDKVNKIKWRQGVVGRHAKVLSCYNDNRHLLNMAAIIPGGCRLSCEGVVVLQRQSTSTKHGGYHVKGLSKVMPRCCHATTTIDIY